MTRQAGLRQNSLAAALKAEGLQAPVTGLWDVPARLRPRPTPVSNSLPCKRTPHAPRRLGNSKKTL